MAVKCKHAVPGHVEEKTRNRNCLRVESNPDRDVLRCLRLSPSHWPAGENLAARWYFSGGDPIALLRCTGPLCPHYEPEDKHV